ncbi:hypothetical protein ACFFJT_02370 [Dyella flava]|uniref:Type 1 fimbrial protein n=1 Tax=Dyella flava TaxID=1920170 RepID=A0ABS2K5J0_9GAMM|nr:hypothetical protein [Dyella flava]MBM7126154.1 hypothetical protein [Dyella flava]GLQ49040.1 hypothetical protein GCM10010872_04890 [Dyella flava]
MRGRRWWVLVGCFFVAVLGASVAKAGGSVKAEGGSIKGGTITFVGALVEPTCNISAAADLLSTVNRAARAQQPYQQSCSGTASAPVNASRTYSASVEHLSSTEPDQVLRYFASYVRATQSSGADPVLVTQTYE